MWSGGIKEKNLLLKFTTLKKIKIWDIHYLGLRIWDPNYRWTYHHPIPRRISSKKTINSYCKTSLGTHNLNSQPHISTGSRSLKRFIRPLLFSRISSRVGGLIPHRPFSMHQSSQHSFVTTPQGQHSVKMHTRGRPDHKARNAHQHPQGHWNHQWVYR